MIIIFYLMVTGSVNTMGTGDLRAPRLYSGPLFSVGREVGVSGGESTRAVGSVATSGPRGKPGRYRRRFRRINGDDFVDDTRILNRLDDKAYDPMVNGDSFGSAYDKLGGVGGSTISLLSRMARRRIMEVSNALAGRGISGLGVSDRGVSGGSVASDRLGDLVHQGHAHRPRYLDTTTQWPAGYKPRINKRQMTMWYQNEPEQCPLSEDGRRLFRCPSSGSNSRTCIDDFQLCNGITDCPGREDEDATYCFFHRVTMSYMDIMSNNIIQLTSALIDAKRKK